MFYDIRDHETIEDICSHGPIEQTSEAKAKDAAMQTLGKAYKLARMINGDE
jgi:hypothetical protein